MWNLDQRVIHFFNFAFLHLSFLFIWDRRGMERNGNYIHTYFLGLQPCNHRNGDTALIHRTSFASLVDMNQRKKINGMDTSLSFNCLVGTFSVAL